MTNHPNRGGLSRNALELIATFSRNGLALEREQQQAVAVICRNALTIKHVAEARCNGPTRYNGESVFLPAEGWTQWEAGLGKRELAAAKRIHAASQCLPGVNSIRTGGDPRGATVKLVMLPGFQHMHDDWGREGVCVPGS